MKKFVFKIIKIIFFKIYGLDKELTPLYTYNPKTNFIRNANINNNPKKYFASPTFTLHEENNISISENFICDK